MYLFKIFSILLSFYCLSLIALYFFQRNILYRPDIIKPELHADYKEVFLLAKDGIKILSWYAKAAAGKQTIIYFHGNAGTIADRVERLHPFIQAGYGVMLVSYRGYAGNPGVPTEQGLYNDARAGFYYLQQQDISLDNIIIFGESLGTGVAVQMAMEYPTKVLVLLSPYTSIIDIGQARYPIFPVKLLLKDKYNSMAKINNIMQDVILLHGKKDKVIPFEYGRALFDAYQGNKEILVGEEAEHANILTKTMANKIIQLLE